MKRLLTVAGSLLIALTLVEAGFRLGTDVTDVPVYSWDPAIGPRRAPNQAGRYIRGTVSARYSFNSQGWNHPREYAVARSAGVRRIAIVGDSYVEALQVNPEESMFAVAERRMNRSDRPVEWLAFGNSGWGTTQEYEVIRTHVLQYRPDVVVLLFVDNDPWDASPDLVPGVSNHVTYALDDGGALVRHAPRPWRPNRWRRLAARSALARYFTIQRPLFPPPSLPDAPNGPLREEAARALSMERATAPGPQRGQRAWLLIEKVLQAVRDESRRHGAELVVAFRGSSGEIEAALTQTPYQAPPRELDPYCLDVRAGEMGREFVGPISEKLGIPYLDLTSALRNEVMRTGLSHIFPDDNHYNAMAHKVAGEALSSWVDSMWSSSLQRGKHP